MPKPPGFSVRIKGLSSRHLPGLNEEPEDPRNCAIEVTASIGVAGSAGADDFDLWFVTPLWLADQGDDPLIPEYMIVVNRFSWATVDAALERLIRAVPAADWDEFTSEFGRYAHWEFSHRQPRF